MVAEQFVVASHLGRVQSFTTTFQKQIVAESAIVQEVELSGPIAKMSLGASVVDLEAV